MLILQYTDQIKLFLSLPKSSHISKNLQKDTSKIWLWDQAYIYAPLRRAFLIVLLYSNTHRCTRTNFV